MLFLTRLPLLGERSPGCCGEMRCGSCPLSGAETYLSAARLLMVSGSVWGGVLFFNLLLRCVRVCHPFSGCSKCV